MQKDEIFYAQVWQGKMAKRLLKKTAFEACVWSCHLFVYFCHSTLLKLNLRASSVEFGSGRRREGQPVPQVARDAWGHLAQWFWQGHAVDCVGMGVEKKPLRAEGRAHPFWMVCALRLCGLEYDVAMLQCKTKMPVRYLLEEIQAWLACAGIQLRGFHTLLSWEDTFLTRPIHEG